MVLMVASISVPVLWKENCVNSTARIFVYLQYKYVQILFHFLQKSRTTHNAAQIVGLEAQ